MFLIFILITKLVSRFCQQGIEERFQLADKRAFLSITYQIFDQLPNINNETMFELISTELEIVSFSYSDKVFQIYDNGSFMADISFDPGEYIQYEIYCLDYKVKPCNFQIKINQLKEIQFKICLEQDFVKYKQHEFPQQKYLSQFTINDLDNQYFHTSLQIKEIIIGSKPIQIIFTQPQGCIFTYNLKTNRIIYCNQQYENELILQQSMKFNMWLYFEFNQHYYDQEFQNNFIIGQSKLDQTQVFFTKISYSFQNQLQLNYPNSIIARFTIIQNNNEQVQNQICMPDCQSCNKQLQCDQCKNDLILENGICYCQNSNQVSDSNGNCLYPANFLQLEETDFIQKCKFGLYFSDIINDCLQCPYENNLPDINCLLKLSAKESDILISNKNQFVNLFKKEIQKQHQQYRCPKNCLACTIINKSILCSQCKNGKLTLRKLCTECTIKNCQYCVELIKETCLICQEFYSLNDKSQCVRSKEYQFEKIVDLLRSSYNYKDNNCMISDSFGCILCPQGYIMQNKVCIQFQDFPIIYDPESIFAKFAYLSFENNFENLYINLEMLNLYKFYFEQSIKTKIYFDKRTDLTPRYYNKGINQYSFCQKIENCENYLQLDFKVIKTKQGLKLNFEEQIFDRVSQIISNLQFYDIDLNLIVINIVSNVTVGINRLQQFLKLDKHNHFVKLNYFGCNIFNDLESDKDLILVFPFSQYLNLTNINFINDYKSQIVVKFKSDEIFINNVNIIGNYSFIFQNQTKVTMQQTQLSQNHIKTNFVFRFLSLKVYILIENVYIYDLQLRNTIIFFIQSGQTYIEFKNCIFHNITLYNSSIIEQSINSNHLKDQEYNNQVFLEGLEYRELQFDNSQIFKQQLSFYQGQNQVIIKNNTITKCRLIESDIFEFDGNDEHRIKLEQIIISYVYSFNTNFFIFNQQNLNQLIVTNISLINCQIRNNFLLAISSAQQAVINGLFIEQLSLQSLQSPFIFIISQVVYISNFNLTNLLGTIMAQTLLIIQGQQIQIQNMIIQSNSDQISLQRGILLKSNKKISLFNINISNVTLYGESLISVQVQNQSIIIIKGLDIDVNFETYPQINDHFDRQILIQIVCQQYFQLFALKLKIQLCYKESYNLVRSALYVKGQSYIKLNNISLDVINNGSSENTLIQLEGSTIEILNTQITFISNKIILDIAKHSNYIFSIHCQNLIMQYLNFSIHDPQLGILNLLPNFIQGDRVIINQIIVNDASQIHSFLTESLGTYKQYLIQNIMITSSMNSHFIYAAFEQNMAQIVLINITLIQQNQLSLNALIIDGFQSIKVNVINFYISKNVTESRAKYLSEYIYITIYARQLNVYNFIIKQLDQLALQVNANVIILNNIFVHKVKSLYNIISIEQASRLIINNAKFLQNQANLSVIQIYLLFCKQMYMNNLLFKENIVQYGNLIGFEASNLGNYSNQILNQIKLIIYNLNSINNICSTCNSFINKINHNLSIYIKESFQIQNKASLMFVFHNFSCLIQDSLFKEKFASYDNCFISSNKQIRLQNSQIILQAGMISLEQTDITQIKSIILKPPNKDNLLRSNSKLQPSALKLSINKLDQEIKLNITQVGLNIKQFQLQDLIYFPSGREINKYKILKLKQKQYLDYLSNIYIYGYDELNQIKLQINQCDLTSDNQNIRMIPNHINSTLLLSDVIVVGNPYLTEEFQVQVNCQYDELNLQLLIQSKLFKCQIGEIFHNNTCQQCQIKEHLYSVQKHSKFCKLIDYDKIESIKTGLIQLRQGYWRPYYSNDQIEQCKLNNCLGGWDVDYDSCKQGYIGPLCTECDNNNIRGSGYYSKYRQQCFLCSYELNYIYNILYIVIASLITLTLTTRSQYLICKRYQMLICNHKYYHILNKLSIDQISVLIKQIQNYFFYLQFINIIFEIDLDLGIVVNTVSNPIQILNPQYDCLISSFKQNQQIVKMIIQIITPVCILTIFYSIVIILNRFQKFNHFYVFIYTPLLSSFIIYQIIICQSAISHLTYIKISGIKWIYGAREYQYFEFKNLQLFCVLSIVILIFAILIPSIFVFVLHSKQRVLQSQLMLMKIGYLYQEYKNTKYYWEFLKMTIKIGYISLCFALINNFNQLVPVSTFYIVYTIQLLKYLQPYHLKNLNLFDQQFHTLLVINLLIIGIVQHIDQTNIKNILMLIVYLTNLLYFAKIIKFIILKTYHNNPQLVDKVRLTILSSNSQSLVETQRSVSNKYSQLKIYAKSQSISVRDRSKLASAKGLKEIQSSIKIVSSKKKNLGSNEIELVTFGQ